MQTKIDNAIKSRRDADEPVALPYPLMRMN
jgi:hypothetical protein